MLQSPIDNQLDKAPVGFSVGRGLTEVEGETENRSMKLRRRANGSSIINRLQNHTVLAI